MAVKASAQIDLVDLTDGYSVSLSKENYTFQGSLNAVSGTQSLTCKVTAMCGSEIVPCTIGTINVPTGISVSNDGKSPEPTLTITATSSLRTLGSFTIPISIGDITINKVFSYSISFKGDNGVSLSEGRMLYTDPIFTEGINSFGRYGGTNVTIERIERESDCPTSSTHQIKISNTGTSSPGCGGFHFGNPSRANAVFIYRIIAKIPVGRNLGFGTNPTGTDRTMGFITNNAGTGKYEEYIYKIACGSEGTFSSTGFFYIDGAVGTTEAPVEWYVGYATAFDMTNVAEGTIRCNIIPSATTFYLSKTAEGDSITPNSIVLTPELFNCRFRGWYYSNDGISYTQITSGENGCEIDDNNVLTIANTSDLFDAYNYAIFKLTTNYAKYQDTVTITQVKDTGYIDEEIGNIKDQVEIVTTTANDAKQLIDSLNANITTTVETISKTQIDEALVETNTNLSILQQTVNSFNFDVIQEKVNELDGTVNTISNYMNFSSEGLTIGASDSPLKLVMSNEKISFVQDGLDVAYVSANKLFINSALITEDISLGSDDHGYYRWGLRTNGNFSLTYREVA